MKRMPLKTGDEYDALTKFKKFIKEATGCNTSDSVLAPLSDHVRRLAIESIRNAGKDDRRTILGRDIHRAVEAYLEARS